MSDGRQRFRLQQGGIPVAWSEGPGALGEILHYATVYSQDGAVQIEAHARGKWRPWPLSAKRKPHKEEHSL